MFSSAVVRFMSNHPRVEDAVIRVAPSFHLWVCARREWLVGRTFTDTPEEYLKPWREFLKDVKEFVHGEA